MEIFLKYCLKALLILGWVFLLVGILAMCNAGFSTGLIVFFWGGWIAADLNTVLDKMFDNMKENKDKEN